MFSVEHASSKGPAAVVMEEGGGATGFLFSICS